MDLSFPFKKEGQPAPEQPGRSAFISKPRIVTSTWRDSGQGAYFAVGFFIECTDTENVEHQIVAEQGPDGKWKLFLNLGGEDRPDIVMSEPSQNGKMTVFKPNAQPFWFTEQDMLIEMQLFEMSRAKDRGYAPREGHLEEDYRTLIAEHGGRDTPQDHIFRTICRKWALGSAGRGTRNDISLS